MAIYHMSVQTIARSKGGNAVAAAAYRAGERIEKYDYSRKSAVDFKAIYAPQNAPEWTTNRAELWAAVEQVEKRKDAQLCREINMALPVELKPEERVALLKEYAHTFVQRGMVADVAIHQQDGHNPHAHMMLTMRELTADGFGGKSRDWNRRELLEEWRESWATLTNQALECAGHSQRVDHRSLAAQGIDREPTKHQGKVSTWVDKTKEPTLRVELNHRLADLAKSQVEVKALQAALVQLEQTPEPKTPQVTAARIRQDTPRPTPTPTPPAAQVQPPLAGAELLPQIKDLAARAFVNWQAREELENLQKKYEASPHGQAAKKERESRESTSAKVVQVQPSPAVEKPLAEGVQKQEQEKLVAIESSIRKELLGLGLTIENCNICVNNAMKYIKSSENIEKAFCEIQKSFGIVKERVKERGIDGISMGR